MANLSNFEKEEFPKILSINIGANHSFKSYEKLKAWAQNEVNFYTNLGNPGNGSNSISQYIINNVKAKISQSRGANFTGEDLVDELKTYIESTYKKHGLIASKSKEGIWLLKQHQENDSLTLGSYTYFHNKIKGLSNSTTAQRDGEFSAYLFDKNIQPNFETEKNQYQAYFEELQLQKDEVLNDLSEIRNENQKLNQEIRKQHQEWESLFEEQKDGAAKKFNDEFDRHSSKMTESEEFYEKKLAVKSAVTYWSNKAKGHKMNSYIFGIIAGLLMILALITVVNFGKYILNLDLTDEKGIGRKILTEDGALQLWVYGFFIASVTLVIWLIRIIVKVFLSNLHLLSDAKERETMIQTYLAFEREENTLKETDRDLILPSIFRVTTNGIIKEDSSPNSPINIITKKVTD